MENKGNSQTNLIYNSANWSYQPFVRAMINVRSKTQDSTLEQVSVEETMPESIKIYDHDEYMQIDMVYPDKAVGQKRFEAFRQSIDIAPYRERYLNHWIWATIEIIPNPLYKLVRLNLSSLENIVILSNDAEGKTLVSFCSPTKTAFIVTDGTNNMDYKNISNVVEYGVISDTEKKMIEQKVYKQNQLNFQKGKFDKQKKFIGKLFGSSKETKQKVQNTNLVESLHMTEQEKQIFDPDMLNVSTGEANPEEALEGLIGLENVKDEVKKLKAKLRYRKKQKDRKIFVDSVSSMHMCFTGSPGTGKTTVARIITGILYNMGYVKENKCVEVNGQNLKGGYTGQTAIITKLVMKSAKNKVLFIDEAYALFDEYEGGFGKEAVAVILKEMEDERDNTIVIFAGYKNDMEEFLSMNDGLKSRINRYIHFKNYNCEELTDILMSYLKKKKLYITEDALAKCILAFKKAETSERFSNGRFVRNMLEKIEYEHAYNTHKIKDPKRQDTIEAEDIPDELIQELLTRSM